MKDHFISKQEVREQVEGMRKNPEDYKWSPEDDVLDRKYPEEALIYNKALEDVLELLKKDI